MHKYIEGDNLPILQSIAAASVDLIYVDPPYNTNKIQECGGNKYKDAFSSFKDFIYPRFEESKRVLKNTGSIFVHLDWHEVHYAKIWLDEIFGREMFRNEIIWHQEVGRSAKNVWARKHTNILWYTVSDQYTFNNASVPMVPRKALKDGYTSEKQQTDVWNYNLSTTDPERVNYPNQKPLAILENLIVVHSNPGDLILDYFGGSGSTGEAAAKHGRSCILIDQNPQSIEIMAKRLNKYGFIKG